MIGILKAYTTRVGSGPFPTELFDEWGDYLGKTGGEVGVTTGRARRCGWFDAVIARYATRVNGITDYFLTKLDVLSSLDKVPICVAYEVDGQRVDEMPMTQTDFHHAKPIYEEMPGWWEDISACRTFEDLPKNAQDYVLRLEELSGARISASASAPAATRPSCVARSSDRRIRTQRPPVSIALIGGFCFCARRPSRRGRVSRGELLHPAAGRLRMLMNRQRVKA